MQLLTLAIVNYNPSQYLNNLGKYKIIVAQILILAHYAFILNIIKS